MRTSILLSCIAALATPAASQTQSEGIKVHGHWVMEVRNADGSVAHRREFQNALSDGGRLLASVLTRAGAVGPWSISLEGANDSPFGTTPAAVATIQEANAPRSDVFKTLTIRGPEDCPLGGDVLLMLACQGKVVLQGNATAARTGRIASVRTGTHRCGANVSPSQCAETYFNTVGHSFTATQIKNQAGVPEPLLLEAGQIVQITVTITFS